MTKSPLVVVNFALNVAGACSLREAGFINDGAGAGVWANIADPNASAVSKAFTGRLYQSRPLQILKRHAVDLHHLHPSGGPGDDVYPRARHAGQLGKEPDAFRVGLAVHRRSGQIQLPGVAEASGDGAAPGPRMDLYRDTRHSTSARRLATPAAARVSTTSKAMASSSQSWLEPSESCVRSEEHT